MGEGQEISPNIIRYKNYVIYIYNIYIVDTHTYNLKINFIYIYGCVCMYIYTHIYPI